MGTTRLARLLLVAAMSGLAATTACSGGAPRAGESASTRPGSHSRVRLTAAPATLHTDCTTAAHRLGFLVPCPSRVPAVGGQGMSCPPPRGAMPAPCVGLEGQPPYPIFALELSGFDVPSDYVGVDGKANGHLVVEARPKRDSPPHPCIGAKRLGRVTVGHWSATEYTCPNDSVIVQREAMHGEGAHAGHLLLEWNQDGIDYLASAHGHTATNLTLLKQLVSSMTLIPPTSS